MFKYLFGPVPSRRLGMSLGVDLVSHKTCSFNCIYCECGRTTLLTAKRYEYIPVSEVIAELKHFFAENPSPDYVTFSGAGEPTLNKEIGKVLSFIKSLPGNPPAAVLTNGSLLQDAEVRKALLPADVVLPSLDTAIEKTFKRMDRPCPEIKLESYIKGLSDFRKEYSNKIFLEVMILPGYNDSKEELEALKKALIKIQPDIIQLNTLDRPGTIKNLQPADKKTLEDITRFWNLENVEIIAAVQDRKQILSYRKDTETAILETISRRPCTVEDLKAFLGIHINQVNKYLGVLEAEGKIESTRQKRGIFYLLKKDRDR